MKNYLVVINFMNENAFDYYNIDFFVPANYSDEEFKNVCNEKIPSDAIILSIEINEIINSRKISLTNENKN